MAEFAEAAVPDGDQSAGAAAPAAGPADVAAGALDAEAAGDAGAAGSAARASSTEREKKGEPSAASGSADPVVNDIFASLDAIAADATAGVGGAGRGGAALAHGMDRPSGSYIPHASGPLYLHSEKEPSVRLQRPRKASITGGDFAAQIAAAATRPVGGLDDAPSGAATPVPTAGGPGGAGAGAAGGSPAQSHVSLGATGRRASTVPLAMLATAGFAAPTSSSAHRERSKERERVEAQPASPAPAPWNSRRASRAALPEAEMAFLASQPLGQSHDGDDDGGGHRAGSRRARAAEEDPELGGGSGRSRSRSRSDSRTRPTSAGRRRTGPGGSEGASASPGSFWDRETRWREQREAKMLALAQQTEDEFARAHPFQPAMNRLTVELLSESADARRRLFQTRRAKKGELLAAELHQREEDDFKRNCTFQPTIDPASVELVRNRVPFFQNEDLAKPRPVQSNPDTAYTGGLTRSLSASGKFSRTDVGKPAISSAERDAYRPHVLGIGADMAAASQYATQPVFERLSNTPTAAYNGYSAASAALIAGNPMSPANARSRSRSASRTRPGTASGPVRSLSRTRDGSGGGASASGAAASASGAAAAAAGAGAGAGGGAYCASAPTGAPGLAGFRQTSSRARASSATRDSVGSGSGAGAGAGAAGAAGTGSAASPDGAGGDAGASGRAPAFTSPSSPAFASSSGRRGSTVYYDGILPQPAKLDPNARFNAVLQRLLDKQHATEQRVKDALDQRKRADSEAAVFKASEGSRKVLEESEDPTVSADFLSRVAQSVHAKGQAADLAERKLQSRVEERFHPVINPYSRQLPSRHIADLSAGDLVRQRELHNTLRRKADDAERASHPFAPQLQAPSASVRPPRDSVLRRDNLEHYAQMLKDMQAERKAAQAQLEASRAERDAAQCTFKPTTTKVPTFISEHAAALRSKRESEPVKPAPKKDRKPDWM